MEFPTEPGEEEKRRVLRYLRRPATQAALLPRVGETLGGFTLEARLGAGTYGTVFRVRRGEGLFALKLLYLPRAGGWAWREFEVALRLHPVGLVGMEAHGHHGHWPQFGTLFLYLVTRYVPGSTLEAWAEQVRPGARDVARVLLGLAEQLALAHAVGVVHRDVKPDNVVVREGEGEAVLVDFGVGTYPGARKVTGALLPGNCLSWAPEAWRFRRERRPGDSYEATPADDLWALGVLAWWLLVGDWPFLGETEEQLEDAVLHGERVAPQERNARVPGALGAVCLRLLEKERAARYADADAVCEALRAALDGADASWEVPLVHAWGPSTRVPMREWAEPALEEEPRARDVSGSGTPPRAETRRGWTRGAWALGALLCAVCVSAVLVGREGVSSARGESVPGGSTTPASWVAWVLADQEMAPPRCPLDGDDRAASPWANLPAPVAFATSPEDGMRMKTLRKTPIPPSTRPVPRPRLSPALCSMAVGAMAVGCPATQVRSSPQAEACSPEAVQNMNEKLGLHVGRRGDALLTEQAGTTLVREGEFSAHTFTTYGKMPAGTVLSGQFVFGVDRVYAHITRAKPPNSDSFPICMDILGEPDMGRGWKILSRSGGDTAEIVANFDWKAVDHFEQ